MLNNKTIAVVVPAYNEESQIGRVIETMPEFVDRIIVVNDFSKDKTHDIVKKYIEKGKNNYDNKNIGFREIQRSFYNEAEIVLQEHSKTEIKYYVPSTISNEEPEKDRIILIDNKKNGGVGSAIIRGYKWAKDNNVDCTAVMAGDGQMDPSELESICSPVIYNLVDYVKGNRLIHRSARFVIPKKRFFGNSILSILTKIASGYWRISDTQTGYTAISLSALKSIDVHRIYKRYGMPNDILVKLNIASCTLREVSIKPIYRIGEQSKMKIYKVIPRISWLLLKSFFKRLWNKYLIRDFHPLFILYHIGFMALSLNLWYLFKLVQYGFSPEGIPSNFLIKFMFLTFLGMQSILFAMWMDFQDNDRLFR